MGQERLARGDGEHRRPEAHQALDAVTHELDLLVDLAGRKQVDLVQHHDHLFAPFANALHEGPLGLGEWPIGRSNEQHQIGTRDEVAGDLFVLAQDRIRPRRIDDRHIAQ